MNPQSINILNELYKNSGTSAESVKTLMTDASGNPIREKMQGQVLGYKHFKDSAEKALLESGITPREQTSLSKTISELSTRLNVMPDKSPSHLSEIMIENSTSGIVCLKRTLNQNPQADPPVREQAESLINLEHANIEEMKQFL